MYEYPAQVLRVKDGDTIDAEVTLRDEAVDLGFDITLYQRITLKLTLRLYGINSPEIRTPEGKTARGWLVGRLSKGTLMTYEPITVDTIKDKKEKYGRYLAVLLDEGGNINEAMVAAGQAFPYDGHGPKPTGAT